MQHALFQWLRSLGLVLLVLLPLTGCSSPEDGRTRGGGPGADVGNKSAQFKPDSKVF